MPIDLSSSVLIDRLPAKFKEVPAFRDFVLSLESLVKDNMWEPVAILQNIRNPRSLERIFLSLTASQLGLQAGADWLNTTAYIRVVESLSEYYRTSGTKDFYRFMGFLVNTQFELDALWTKDYVKFYTVPGGVTAYEGGEWYLTPHVNLKYDGEVFDPLTKDLHKLFYLMAPIHLVLEAIVQVFYSNIPGGISLAGNIEDIVVGGDFIMAKIAIGSRVMDYMQPGA
jgi:hypothetical protein